MTWRGVPPAVRADGRRVEDAYRRALGAVCVSCSAPPGRRCRGPRIERLVSRLATFVQTQEATGKPVPYSAAQLGMAGLHRERQDLGWLFAPNGVRSEPPEAASGPVTQSHGGNPTPRRGPAEDSPQAPPGPGPAQPESLGVR